MLQPARWLDIAINAVMAGCQPECLPVVGARSKPWQPRNST
jgi:hypothetical protein